MRCVLECPDARDDRTNFLLYFQNRQEEDILLRDELDKIAKKHASRVTIVYYCSNPQGEDFGMKTMNTHERRGYVNKKDIRQEMGVDKCQLICICGPSAFNDAMKQLCLSEGHKDDGIYIW